MNRAERRRRAKQARGVLKAAGGLPEADMQRAVALHRSGALKEAVALYRMLLPDRPEDGELVHLLGLALGQLGQSEAAAETLAQATQVDPEKAQYWANLGKALQDAGRLEQAADALRRAVALDGTLAKAHLTLGSVLFGQRRFEEAGEVYRNLLAVAPQNGDSHYNLGWIAQHQEKFEEAAAHYERLLRLDPDHVRGLTNLGVVLMSLERPDDSAALLQRAVRLDPSFVLASYNLGLAQAQRGELAASLAAYDLAIERDPDYPSAHWNRALALLMLGRFAEGWDEHEWRWRSEEFRSVARHFELPTWDGTPLDGRRLLVWAEQGLGDHIMFASLLSDAGLGGGAVTVESDPRLIPLLARSVPAMTYVAPESAAASEAAFDLQIAAGSLPRLFRRDEADFPRRRGFLKPDAERVADIGARCLLRARGRLLIGLSWRSGSSKSGTRRTIALDDLLAVLRHEGCCFVNLQYGEVAAEIDSLAAEHGVEILREPSVDPTEDIDGLAALSAGLDLVITVGNTTAHVSGAVGTPTWVMLPSTPSWRWMAEREDSPWYPALRLFRQEAAGDWAPVIERVRDALDAFVASRGS